MLRVLWVLQAPWEILVPVVSEAETDPLEPRVCVVTTVPQAAVDLLDPWAPPGLLACLALLVQREIVVRQGPLALWDPLVLLELTVALEPPALVVSLALVGMMVVLDLREHGEP